MYRWENEKNNNNCIFFSLLRGNNLKWLASLPKTCTETALLPSSLLMWKTWRCQRKYMPDREIYNWCHVSSLMLKIYGVTYEMRVVDCPAFSFDLHCDWARWHHRERDHCREVKWNNKNYYPSCWCEFSNSEPSLTSQIFNSDCFDLERISSGHATFAIAM